MEQITTPSSTSSAPATTTVTIPQFTPEPGCLGNGNIWYDERLCETGVGFDRGPSYTCGYFNLGDGSANDPDIVERCRPDVRGTWRYPQTVCPEAYSGVLTNSHKRRVDSESHTFTKWEIRCCPTAGDFKFVESASFSILDDTVEATVYRDACLAQSPSMGGPEDLTVRSWSVNSASESAVVTLTTRFDADADQLFAELVTIGFEVDADGTTCAPNCETPWTGGKWPVSPPTEIPCPESECPSPPSDSSLRGAGTSIGLMVGVPVGVVLLLVLAGGLGCLYARKRKARKARAAASVNAVDAMEQHEEVPVKG